MFYNKYLVIGGAQNITKKCGSLPNNHKHIATMRQVQKLKQKSQSSISATIEIPISSFQSLNFVLSPVLPKNKIIKVAIKATIMV